MFYKETSELKEYVMDIYENVKCHAETLSIFKPLDVCFNSTPPINYEGVFCYTDKKGYHYCFTERGELKINNTTYSLFEITYWAVCSPIRSMASDYEKKHRKVGQDFRRIMFKKELELFDYLGENYKKRAEIEIDEILKIAPYDDTL